MPVSAFGGEPTARHLSQHACIAVQQSLLPGRSSTGRTCPIMTREPSDVASNRETQCGVKPTRVTELVVKSAVNGSPWFRPIHRQAPHLPLGLSSSGGRIFVSATAQRNHEELEIATTRATPPGRPTPPHGAPGQNDCRLRVASQNRIRCHDAGTSEPDLGEQLREPVLGGLSGVTKCALSYPIHPCCASPTSIRRGGSPN